MPRRFSSTMLTMITGVSASSASWRSAASTDQPSRSGIMTSSVIAIGRSSLASLIPSRPPSAVATAKPSDLRCSVMQVARGGVVVDDQHAVPDWAARAPL